MLSRVRDEDRWIRGEEAMSDLIRREDAIKAVWGDDINPNEDGMVFEAQSHIDRDIRLIPSADRPQGWIPCSERVPIEYRTVLVTWEYAGKSYTTTAFRKTKNAVTYWASNEQPKYTPLKVVAWMPLPEPWEGADDGTR